MEKILTQYVPIHATVLNMLIYSLMCAGRSQNRREKRGSVAGLIHAAPQRHAWDSRGVTRGASLVWSYLRPGGVVQTHTHTNMIWCGLGSAITAGVY